MILILCAATSPSSTLTCTLTRTLTNEEIVRLTAHGMPPEEIIRAIREASSVSFDLDPEVVAEMRLVGVKETVIQAMKEAQSRHTPAAPPATAVLPAGATGTIALILEGQSERAKAPALPLPSLDVSFFLLCMDPTHVPDQWQTATPLAEGFPRHHKLWFQEAPPREKGKGRGGRSMVSLPGPVEIKVEPGVHPIEVGVAARDDKRVWRPLAEADASLTVRAGETTRLVVRARVTRAPGKPPLSVEIVEPAQPPADIKR